MFEFFQDEHRYYLVTEICKGGELFEDFHRHFEEQEVILLLRTLLIVVNYCHTRGVVHRDLKPENLMLEANHDYDQVKVVDFGAATRFVPGKYLDQKVGTSYYIAPEVLRKAYSQKCDLWSCGVIAYTMLSGGIPPFNGVSDQEIMKKVKLGKYVFHTSLFKEVSEVAKDFVSKLLQYDPEKRISAQEALQHQWITGFTLSNIDQTLAQEALANLKTFRADQKLK